jgi:hypothetical protein
MDDPALVAYSDARGEYTKQLCQFAVPAIMRLFLDILQRSREETKQEPKRVLIHFQNELSEIPDWNMERVSNEIEALQDSIGCEYLEDLITAVFVAHTKILTAIRMNTRQKKVQITVPKVEHFLFKAVIETSKIFWKSTYLFRDDVTNIEKQQNYRQIEGLVGEGVAQAIRCMVPVKSILRDCMAPDVEEAEVTPEPEPVPEPAPEPVPEPVPALEPVPVPVPAAEPVYVEETPVSIAEPITPLEPEAPIEEVVTISAEEDAPKVQFADYKSVFDIADPEASELIIADEDDYASDDSEDSEDSHEHDVRHMRILDEEPTAITEFENLDDAPAEDTLLSISDGFETLE